MSSKLAVHSLEHFAVTVPDVAAAARFYESFGLDVHRHDRRIDLHTYGHSHCWGSVHEGAARRLAYVSYGIYSDDEAAFRELVARRGDASEPHVLGRSGGIWLRDPDGVPVQLVPAEKVSPSRKAASMPASPAPSRSKVAPVRPRRLSHVLRFTPDVPRMVQFCTELLGLRLSDRSQDLIAFLHTPHGSDHHLVAFAKSEAPGLHHTSWDVASIDEVGCGAEQMRARGYLRGWGVGRHVLGSNYFYYAQDPWGSFAEYSFDIEFIAPGTARDAGDHPAEDAFYIWGPPPPEDFTRNYESGA